MNGRNSARLSPSLYSSSGARFDVATITTPSSNSRVNSRPRIMASAMSVTWNSSKHSSQVSSAIAAAARWIGSCSARAVLDVLPVDVHALMHVGHEFVEMHAALALHRAGREEQVHQHGLAAADLAVDVKPFQRRAGLRGVGRTASRARTTCAPAGAARGAARAPSDAPRARPGRDRPRFFRRR